MLQITHSNELVQQLSSRIADTDNHWFIDVAEMLEQQSDEVLSDLLRLSEGFSERCWGSVSHTLEAFIRGGGGVPDNTHLVRDGLPHEEFALKMTFLLIPMAVRHHERSIGSKERSFEGGSRQYSVVDMYEAATSDVYRMLGELLPDAESLTIARACYLITLYGRRHKVPLPAGGDFTWMSENALEIIPIADSVFNEGVFDRGLAELMVKAEPPLRVGVL